MTSPDDARGRYIALEREGEAAGLTYQQLGRFIADRMTPEDLRALLRDYYTTHDYIERKRRQQP